MRNSGGNLGNGLKVEPLSDFVLCGHAMKALKYVSPVVLRALLSQESRIFQFSVVGQNLDSIAWGT